MTKEDIKDSIIELSLNASPGPDEVPAIMMKKCKDSQIDSLQNLWKKSMDTGIIPELFQTAYVTPILKPGGSKSIPAHYRPVKIFEFSRNICKDILNII